MARNRNRTFAKRKREQERNEKAAHKRARKRARGASPGMDTDSEIEQIVVGPQPRDEPTKEEIRLAQERAMNPRNKSARETRNPSFGSRLFVGNLDATAQEHEISELFAKAGFPVAETFIPRDRATGEPRGIAFVELSNARDSKKAIEAMDGSTFHSRQLRVNAANQPRPR